MRSLPGLILCALTTLAAPSSTALAGHPATYKGRFDFEVKEFVPITDKYRLLELRASRYRYRRSPMAGYRRLPMPLEQQKKWSLRDPS